MSNIDICCCTCDRNKRTKDDKGCVECHCQTDGHYIGYLESFHYACGNYKLDEVYMPGGKWYENTKKEKERTPMISIIVARAANNIIGDKGTIPWKIPEDMHHFKEITTGGVVIMGRKTYESIGKPLSNRVNIIVSRTMSSKNNVPDKWIVPSLDTAIAIARSEYPEKEIFLIGGHSIYQAGIEIADKLYITELTIDVQGDTEFVYFNENDYYKTVTKEAMSNGVLYSFVEYQRKQERGKAKARNDVHVLLEDKRLSNFKKGNSYMFVRRDDCIILADEDGMGFKTNEEDFITEFEEIPCSGSYYA